MEAVNKIRFGVVGTNFITDWVINAARLDPRFELVAVYSRTQERADDFAEKHAIPYTFTSLEEMAASSLIDAVYIASPNYLHASQSILFMQHGKHVLCEKPLASNAKEVREMIKASRKYKVTFMEAMKPTLTPAFAQIRKMMTEIGTVRRYFACYCQYSSRYDKLKEGVVLNAFNPEISNGALMDIGVYTVYPMVALFGRPNKIQASGLRLHTGVDGQGAVSFEYDTMTATVLYSKITDSFLPTEIQGEDGIIIADRINIISRLELRYRKGDITLIENPNKKNEYYYEMAEFLNLIQAEKIESAINSHETSLINMEVMDEIRRQLGVVYPADK